MKTHIIIFTAIGTLLFLMFQPLFFPDNSRPYAALTKSRLKQIAASFEFHFSEFKTDTYPSPDIIDLDPYIIGNVSGENWIEYSLNGPYYFFPTEGQKYTGSPEVPIATNWEALPIKPHFQIVWEDGRVTNISREEQLELINSSLKGKMNWLVYTLSFKNNQVFE